MTVTGPGRRRRWDRISLAAVFVGLPGLLYVGIVVWPLVQAAAYSLTNWSGFSPSAEFVGPANFGRVLHDDRFWAALRTNGLLLVTLPLVMLGGALVLASLLTVGGVRTGRSRGLRGSSFYRAVIFFPYLIPGVAAGVMWGRIYDPSAGLLNGALTAIGLEGFKDFAWLGDTTTAFPSVVFTIVWGGLGFFVTYFVAAISGLDPEVFDSARIDGAGPARTLWHITLPLLRESIVSAAIFVEIGALDAYAIVTALTPDGGPDRSTFVLSQYLMQAAFKEGAFGTACAIGIVIALVTFAVSAALWTARREPAAQRGR
ncbi:carbohydrate ABC transporter permease [Kribbella sp. GL6]|uniref:carbohydrate ABC transporter permease n=1 Tax=Kribbella sp. GL6 TaxID=3419765 RepID=UPI003D015B61